MRDRARAPFDSQHWGFDSGVEGFIDTKRALPHRSPPLERVGEPHAGDSTPTLKKKTIQLGQCVVVFVGLSRPPRLHAKRRVPVCDQFH